MSCSALRPTAPSSYRFAKYSTLEVLTLIQRGKSREKLFGAAPQMQRGASREALFAHANQVSDSVDVNLVSECEN